MWTETKHTSKCYWCRSHIFCQFILSVKFCSFRAK